ncbi:MAG: hypothetical protein IJ551_11145 [Prevotella sp.]|nr:hypothetical protein [Prevotella sp.]
MKRNPMTHVVLAMLAVLLLSGCSGGSGDTTQLKQQVDSLRQADEQHKKELNDLTSFVETLSEGLNAISVQEEQLFDGSIEGGANAREQMLLRIESFSELLTTQRERIKAMSDSLAARGANLEKLQNLINLLNQQIDQKDKMISQLRNELKDKDVDIAKLKSHVGKLTKANQEFAAYVEKQQKSAAQQEELDNTVYVVVGSADLLKQAGIISGGGFLSKKKVNADIPKEYLTKKNMRSFTQLEIPSAKAKLISDMPKNSYKIEKTGSDQSVLTITDVANFWSRSRYLVIQTK